ncbi:MAG: ABC transporter substrate-binding protein [Deltaproteobacteria bacterium]|nr:ABC transporter substrate-binding protein [Deltaproteobacteria bacterium]
MNKWRTIWLATFILVAILFTASGQSQELRKVRVGIPTLTLIVASSLVPTERGYFKQEGLDVELVVIRSAPSVLALAAKEIDFLMTGGGGLAGTLRGLPLRVVFTPLRRPTYALYVKPEIRSFNDLDGKRVGISSYGSGPDLLLRDIMKKRMADGGKKVAVLAVGGGGERYIALKTNIVDAAVLSTPFTLNAKQDGYREIYSFITEKEYADIPVATFTRDDSLLSNSALVERFVRAQVKGLLYMRANRERAISSIARALKAKEETIAGGFDEIRPALTDDGTISPDDQRRALEYLMTPAQQKDPPRLDRIYDFALTKKVHQELQTRGWKPE